MNSKLERLNLHDNYIFDVIVKDPESDNNFAGKLVLTPQECTLKIMGESTSDRECSISWKNLDELRCTDHRQTFILRNLIISNSSSKIIQSHPNSICFFEIKFIIGFILFLPSNYISDLSIRSISIHSESINSWIGNTKIQENIALSDDPFGDATELDEFILKVNESTILGVSYNLTAFHSSPEFKAGKTFPPSLIAAYHKGLNPRQVKSEYDKIYYLFSFLIGSNFIPEYIKITYKLFNHSQSGSLYFPTAKLQSRQERTPILFPLGKGLRHNQLGLPALPLEAICAYFTLTESDLDIWKKYAYYQRMQNSEERFLGYFRLLEKLCFKTKSFLDEPTLSELIERVKPYMVKKFGEQRNVSAFLKGISRYNNSKYNTSKCIQDFYATIPQEIINKWKYQKYDIDKVCKLRNDISHANDLILDEKSLLEDETFVQVLLIFTMFNKIGITIDTSSKIIDRLSGYRRIILSQV